MGRRADGDVADFMFKNIFRLSGILSFAPFREIVMPWPARQRASTRQRILDSASRLFAIEGFERVSIDMIMQDAGLTRGAFYSHFESKSDLYNEAISNAAKAGGALLEQAGAGGLRQVVEAYLQMGHRDGSAMHCPLAFMINDAATQDATIRDRYTQVFSGFLARLETTLARTHPNDSRQRALQMATGMIGGVALARAISDKELASELLEACQSGCTELLR
jgi:TetR/AcrR family transcriptional repressor of nem operon